MKQHLLPLSFENERVVMTIPKKSQLPPLPPSLRSVNGDGVTVGSKGSDLKTSLRTEFPLGLVEGQENIKTALLLTAINPDIQGVIISGEHGVGKTVMARGTSLSPPPSLPPSPSPPLPSLAGVPGPLR